MFFIIFGAKTKNRKVEPEKVLKSKCPLCKGDLRKYESNRWFTLFFIPIFPYKTIEHFYACDKCREMYSVRIKELLKNKKIAAKLSNLSQK